MLAGVSSARRLCTPWTYFAHAALHPGHIFVAVVAVLVFARHPSVEAFAVGIAMEAAFLGVTPRCASFRRAVHHAMDEKQRLAELRVRDALLLQMADLHCEQLGQIEVLLADALAHAARRSTTVTLGGRDRLAMDRLTLGYMHLAVEHRARALSLSKTDPTALSLTVQSLENAAAAQPTSPILRQWLSIAKRRSERLGETRAAVETLGYQLAAITDLAHLIHEESLSASTAQLTDEIDGILAEFEHGEAAAREVAQMHM